MSKDPTRFRGGLNLYGYCYGDPVNLVDVTGRLPDLPTIFPTPSELLELDEIHRNRNRFNQCPLHPPTAPPNSCGLNPPDDRNWARDPKAPIPHIPGLTGKWRASDGTECDYDDNGDLIPDAGSFNFCPYPYSICHIFSDVLPDFIFGSGYTKTGR